MCAWSDVTTMRVSTIISYQEYVKTLANNSIDAGPFGGCVPVQMVGADAAGNGTAVAKKRASLFNA